MMKLIGMLDSPYVRRVAVSLALYGVEFEHLPLSVFSAVEPFAKFNPVVKAPTLILDNAVRLMDSTLILHYFESQADLQRKLLPAAGPALAEDLQTLGWILAASEKAVQQVYEHRLRPPEKQYQPWIERITWQLLSACREWNAALERRALNTPLDQVSVTSAVVWTFIQAMIPDVVKADDFHSIRAHSEIAEAHPALKQFPFP
ncbi:TPA: glutathione S-transferase family protein [Raoultella ornithinolytica]|uniref:glutathione S-transferase family protein n=1 Tax=Raoultella ornithinolytica TaxID=54291 RepID=UPI00117D2A1B|nr:glutathione S-transferase family protein [Raoultella ornithinolytica]